jgi:parallel beta-helix repeat protein
MPVGVTIKTRRGTAAEWSAVNPTLAAGEPGYETDTGILKIGDGVTAYTSLDYIGTKSFAGSEIDTLLTTVSGSNLSADHKITRSATIVVAASDSSEKSKAQADYVCDGIADNEEIMAAINALPTAGGCVTLMEGTYQLSDRIYPTTKKTNMWLIGYGAKLVAPSTTTVNYPINFHSTYKHDSIHIRGIEIDGNGTSTGGIRISASNSDVIDCYVHNVAAGVGMFVWSESGILSNVTLENNRIVGTPTTMTYGIQTAGTVEDIKISKNRIENTKFNGIAAYGGPTTEIAQNIIISGNRVINTGHSAIAASPSSYGIISNNIISDIPYADEAGIEIEYKLSHGTDTSHHYTIVGNVVYNCNWGIATHNRDDEVGKDPHDIAIIGNTVSDCTVGINLLYGNGIVVSGNNLEGNATQIMKGAGVDAKIYGNTGYVTENTGTATITTGQTTVDVTHGLAAAPTRVLLSPTTATAGKQYYVSAKGATTFTITIDSAADADISFDWQAVI